jgi:hypothetical protein
MSARVFLGAWTLPSGNGCDMYLDPATRALDCQWDRPPDDAWSDADLADYLRRILPAIVRAAAEVFEVPASRPLVIFP